MLTWAGQNFPNWTPSNRTKPELVCSIDLFCSYSCKIPEVCSTYAVLQRLSTYNQFRLLVLETYADQVEESMDEVIAQLQASVLVSSYVAT